MAAMMTTTYVVTGQSVAAALDEAGDYQLAG
jgi:hypothetical protein